MGHRTLNVKFGSLYMRFKIGQEQGTQNRVRRTQNMQHGAPNIGKLTSEHYIWNMEFQTWNSGLIRMEFQTWNLECGTLNMELCI